MPYIFPPVLNTPLQASYSREETITFAASQPASGPYYVQILTDDAPAYFQCEWVFTADAALAFRSFLRQDNGAVFNGAEFDLELPIEGGNAMQTAVFTPDGVPQLIGKERDLLRFSGRIMVRKLNEIGEGSEALIIGAVEAGGFDLLDTIVNEDMPNNGN